MSRSHQTCFIPDYLPFSIFTDCYQSGFSRTFWRRICHFLARKVSSDSSSAGGSLSTMSTSTPMGFGKNVPWKPAQRKLPGDGGYAAWRGEDWRPKKSAELASGGATPNALQVTKPLPPALLGGGLRSLLPRSRRRGGSSRRLWSSYYQTDGSI